MARDLAEVLADFDEEAGMLKRRGYTQHAASLFDLIAAVRAAAEDYLTFIPESQALLRGAKMAVLRRNFPAWEQDGHAKRVAGVRYYRAIMLPRITPASIAREAGRRGERPDSQRRAG